MENHEEAKTIETLLAAGDERCMNLLFAEYYRDLCAYAARYPLSAESVEDIVQNVFISFWENKRGRPFIGSVRSYLFGAVSKAALRWLRDEGKAYFEDIAEGMRMAVVGGTCRNAQFPGYEVCGKTGTAQNPHGKDHSSFMGFAPMVNPKIAICVYVENGGWGATYGVPIGGLMMEMYLNGKIAPERKYIEERILQSNTILYSGVKKH